MAHSNHYFRMNTKLSPERHIDLLSRGPEYGEVGEVFNNMIQLVVKGPIYGTEDNGEIGIWLTQKEQDDLIVGILERRGLAIYRYCGTEHGEIHSDGQQQSSIHPVIH